MLVAQNSATQAAPAKPANHVTFTQAAPSLSQLARQRHHDFCSDEAWNYYFDHYASAATSSQAVEPLDPPQPLSRVEEVPDERVQSLSRVESQPRAEEIPDERVQEIPDERIGPPVPALEDSFPVD